MIVTPSQQPLERAPICSNGSSKIHAREVREEENAHMGRGAGEGQRTGGEGKENSVKRRGNWKQSFIDKAGQRG